MTSGACKENAVLSLQEMLRASTWEVLGSKHPLHAAQGAQLGTINKLAIQL
jgi:hypothetical protein